MTKAEKYSIPSDDSEFEIIDVRYSIGKTGVPRKAVAVEVNYTKSFTKNKATYSVADFERSVEKGIFVKL